MHQLARNCARLSLVRPQCTCPTRKPKSKCSMVDTGPYMQRRRFMAAAATTTTRVEPFNRSGFGAHLRLPVTPDVGVSADLLQEEHIQRDLRAALLKHRIVAVPHVRMDQFKGGVAAGMLAASHVFGQKLEVKGTKGEKVQMYVVQDRSREPRGSDEWHSDLSYCIAPSWVTLLWAAQVPRGPGGDTLFCDMAGAWQQLDDTTQQRLQSLTATHTLKLRLNKNKDAAEVPRAEHPVRRPHPVTGEPFLYVNPGYTLHLNEVSAQESDTLLTEVYRHCLQDCFVLRYRWNPGDLLIWDNATVMHKATTLDMLPGTRRVMFRTSVVG